MPSTIEIEVMSTFMYMFVCTLPGRTVQRREINWYCCRLLRCHSYYCKEIHRWRKGIANWEDLYARPGEGEEVVVFVGWLRERAKKV